MLRAKFHKSELLGEFFLSASVIYLQEEELGHGVEQLLTKDHTQQLEVEVRSKDTLEVFPSFPTCSSGLEG